VSLCVVHAHLECACIEYICIVCMWCRACSICVCSEILIAVCIIIYLSLIISTEYAEVADTVKKYFKKLCKRYFNEVYLKEKEEKERTPSPDHEKAVKEFEDESESDDDSGSDSDASEFGVPKKPKQKRGKGGEKDEPIGIEASAHMWPHGPRGPVGPNGLTINSGTLENLRRLTGGVNTFPPRMPPGLPPNAPPHIQQEYYAKMQMYQRQRCMQEMMRRQQHHQQQHQQQLQQPQQQQGGGYPRYPPPGMRGIEGMSSSGPPPHGMPPHHPHHPEMYGNMMGPHNYPYPGDHMMHPYQQQHPGYRGHRPPYHNYPNNSQENYRMPPPDYNEAAKAQWYKSHRVMLSSQGEEITNDGSGIKSSLDKNIRRSSVSSEGTGVKSPLSSEVVRSPASSLPAQPSSDSNQPPIATTSAKVADQPEGGNSEKQTEILPPDSAGNEKPEVSKQATEAASATRQTAPQISVSQPQNETTAADASKQQPPQADNEAYKRGMEAAYKYHKEQQMRKKQQQQQQTPAPGYPPGYMGPEMGFSSSPQRGGKPYQHQQRMVMPENQQEYMHWQQQQEAMWRSQQMGMPTTPMGSPYPGGNPGGGMPYNNSGYPPSSMAKGMEASPDTYKQQQEYHQMQQYMMNRRYMDDMYRQHGYGHPGMHPGVNSYPYGHHHPGYSGRSPYHKSMQKPTEKGSGQPVDSPHPKSEAPGPGEEIPDYTESLRKYAMGLTGTNPATENQDAQVPKKGDTAGEDNTVSSSKEEDKTNSITDEAQVETAKTDKKDDQPPTELALSTKEENKPPESSESKTKEDEKDSAEDDNKDAASSNVTSPSSSVFPPADSTTQGGSTPDSAKPPSQPSSGGAAAQNGHNKGHYPPSMYPPQHAQQMYGGWGGGGMSHSGYGRGMYPPPPMGGRPESMEEYERYRTYHEQMMAMRHMAPPDPYNGMGMPPQGMSPYDMEQYHHYEMMQGRMGPQMGGNAPPMGGSGYPGGDQYQQRHTPSQEDMKKYLMRREQMAAMHKQMKTAYHQQQQQQQGMPYGPHASMPSDYSAGVTSPLPQAGQHNKMSAPTQQQKHPMQQGGSTMTREGTPELNNSTQEPATSEGIVAVCVHVV